MSIISQKIIKLVFAMFTIGLLLINSAASVNVSAQQIRDQVDKVENGQEIIDRCGTKSTLGKLVPDVLFDFDFSNACLNHDLCYANPQQKKEVCDAEFYYDMIDVCNDTPFKYLSWSGLNIRNKLRLNKCYRTAYTYYTAVYYYGIRYIPAQTTVS